MSCARLDTWPIAPAKHAIEGGAVLLAELSPLTCPRRLFGALPCFFSSTVTYGEPSSCSRGFQIRRFSAGRRYRYRLSNFHFPCSQHLRLPLALSLILYSSVCCASIIKMASNKTEDTPSKDSVGPSSCSHPAWRETYKGVYRRSFGETEQYLLLLGKHGQVLKRENYSLTATATLGKPQRLGYKPKARLLPKKFWS